MGRDDLFAQPLRPGEFESPLLADQIHQVQCDRAIETADRPMFDRIGHKILRLGLLVAQAHLTVAQVMIHQGESILWRDILQVQRLNAKEPLVRPLIGSGIHHELIKTLPSFWSERKHARRPISRKRDLRGIGWDNQARLL